MTLGWCIRFDLNQCQNWDHLAETFRRFNPDRSAGSVAQSTRMFWDFLIGYRKGDVIVMPRRGPHRRSVSWIARGDPFRAVVVIMHAGFLAGLWTARDRLDCRDDWFDSGDYLWALSIARYIPIPGRTP